MNMKTVCITHYHSKWHIVSFPCSPYTDVTNEEIIAAGYHRLELTPKVRFSCTILAPFS